MADLIRVPRHVAEVPKRTSPCRCQAWHEYASNNAPHPWLLRTIFTAWQRSEQLLPFRPFRCTNDQDASFGECDITGSIFGSLSLDELHRHLGQCSMADGPDPNDVESLEKSLSDSASRVSTLWISYLIFGLYLLIAAGTATHRQLLSAEPLKLPVLGSDVPLVWFFVISPALLVILHFYLLMQVLFLGRTAQAYDLVLNRALKVKSDNDRVRQRLANTLFAQYFAGASRERHGWIGSIIKSIAWITLIGGPIFLIFTFQLTFLAYHDSTVAWVHRSLICFEVVIAIILGPIVVNPRLDFNAASLASRTLRAVKFPWRFFLRLPRGIYRPWLGLHYIRRSIYLLLIVISWFVIVFPGEWHINRVTSVPLDAVDCDRRPLLDGWKWLNSRLDGWDRLTVTNESIVDADKIAKWDTDAPREQARYEGARSKDLSGRDLNCGTFDSTDFRRANLANARFLNAKLRNARLEGADMRQALLETADLSGSYMNGADLAGARLSRAAFLKAKMDGVIFTLADLRMADLSLSSLVGADFTGNDKMQGINLIGADMRAARLIGAHLEGASLQRANLDGAILTGASLVAAELEDTQLQAVSLVFQPSPKPGFPNDKYDPADFSLAHLRRTWLALSDMGRTNFTDAVMFDVSLWWTTNIDCSKAFVSVPNLSARIKSIFDPDPKGVTRSKPFGIGVDATPNALAEFEFDLGGSAERAIRNLFKRTGSPPSPNCPDNSGSRKYDPAAFADLIADRICNEPNGSVIGTNREAVAAGILRNALDSDSDEKELAYVATLAERFRAKTCAPTSIDPRDQGKFDDVVAKYRKPQGTAPSQGASVP